MGKVTWNIRLIVICSSVLFIHRLNIRQLLSPEQDWGISRQESGSDCSRAWTPVRLHVSTRPGCRPGVGAAWQERGERTSLPGCQCRLIAWVDPSKCSKTCVKWWRSNNSCNSWEENLMYLSAVPPPLARSPWWWGDQAIAFTAARCSVYLLSWIVTTFLTIAGFLTFASECSPHRSTQTICCRCHHWEERKIVSLKRRRDWPSTLIFPNWK